MREWKRGQKLTDAVEIWRGEPTDVVASGSAYWDKGHRYKVWYRAKTFYDTVRFVPHPDAPGRDGPRGHPHRLFVRRSRTTW